MHNSWRLKKRLTGAFHEAKRYKSGESVMADALFVSKLRRIVASRVLKNDEGKFAVYEGHCLEPTRWTSADEVRRKLKERTRRLREYTKPIVTANAPIFGVEIEGKKSTFGIGRSLVQKFITDDFRTRREEAGQLVLLNTTTCDERGNVIGVVSIGQVSTAHLSQEREYSKLIDTANAPIFGVDTQGRVNVWDQRAMRLVGCSAEEYNGGTTTV